MRVLFLDLTIPVPADNGHKLRTWALLRALAGEGHEVTMVAFARPGEGPAPPAALRGVCARVVTVPLRWTNLSAAGDHQARLRALVRPWPYAVGRFASADMRDQVLRGVADGGADIVICDVFTAINLPPLNVPVVVNLENIEHVVLRRYLACERHPLRRAYGWLEYRKMWRWEQALGARASLGLACSATDRTIVRRLCPSLPVHVAPNVVDLPPARWADMAGEEGTVLFQGGMDWYPNRDAVDFFVSGILPRLRARVPSVRFIAAGRNPFPAFVRRFANRPEVSFTGTVPDMRPVIARASVCVVPLRIGSGTRLKILESAGMSRAVVSTRVGAEGLGFVPGEEIVLADEPDAFADAVADLLVDAERRRALGDAARARVARHYTLRALQTALATGFDRIPSIRRSTLPMARTAP